MGLRTCAVPFAYGSHTGRCKLKFVDFLRKHKRIGCAGCPVFTLGSWKINLPRAQCKLFANHLVQTGVPVLILHSPSVQRGDLCVNYYIEICTPFICEALESFVHETIFARTLQIHISDWYNLLLLLCNTQLQYLPLLFQ